LRNDVWLEELTLWSDAVSKSPNKARPYNGLGVTYRKKGMLDEAILQLKRAIEPNFSKAHNNLGAAYWKKGLIDRAIAEYKKGLIINPNYAIAHNNLAMAYYKKGD
jgi:tetratricopeptide (TPR) repeat protein